MLEILLALIAGVLTIAAPCILLPLPILLGGSVGHISKTRPLFITLGFTLTFAILGLSLNFLVQSLGLDPNVLRTGAVILLGIFAMFMIWPTPFEKLASHLSSLITKASQTGRSAGTGNFGGFIMGIILGIIWASCAGPILGSILTLIAQETKLLNAGILLLAYSLGAGLPMLAIAYGGQTVTTRVRVIARYSARLQQIFGVILILLAGAIYLQYDTKLQAYLVDKFPIFNAKLEESLLKKIDSAPAPTPNSSSEVLIPAPDFTGISNWLNSEALTLPDLKGKVVLVDFWTYSCINCVRTLPYLVSWYEKYKEQGFIVIGVHTPEFAFEKSKDNVANAIRLHNITYPVAQDNDYKTWTAYSNRYWPAKYLIDQQGNIRYTHFGEGQYEKTEKAIAQLLGEPTTNLLRLPQNQAESQASLLSPEIYLGLNRLKNLHPKQTPSPTPKQYELPKEMLPNSFALEGLWQFDQEKVSLLKAPGKIRLYFAGSEVNLVATSKLPQDLKVTAPSTVQQVPVASPNLYRVFQTERPNTYLIEIEILKPDFEAYTFTFG